MTSEERAKLKKELAELKTANRVFSNYAITARIHMIEQLLK